MVLIFIAKSSIPKMVQQPIKVQKQLQYQVLGRGVHSQIRSTLQKRQSHENNMNPQEMEFGSVL